MVSPASSGSAEQRRGRAAGGKRLRIATALKILNSKACCRANKRLIPVRALKKRFPGRAYPWIERRGYWMKTIAFVQRAGQNVLTYAEDPCGAEQDSLVVKSCGGFRRATGTAGGDQYDCHQLWREMGRGDACAVDILLPIRISGLSPAPFAWRNCVR